MNNFFFIFPNALRVELIGTGYGSVGITLPGQGIIVGKGVYLAALDMVLLSMNLGISYNLEYLELVDFIKIRISSLYSAS